METQATTFASSPNLEKSYFDGKLSQLIGWTILAVLLTLFTLTLAFPWALCMIYRWETKHTVIEGRRLKFNGTGGQLFLKNLLWTFLTIITLGIFAFWRGIAIKKWIVKHTEFAD